MINFEEQRGPTAEQNDSIPSQIIMFEPLVLWFPRSHEYFDFTWKPRQNLSNTHLGYDLHFDMQKLIPQTQLLMCRLQLKKEKDGKKASKKKNNITLPLFPFPSNYNRREVMQRAECDVTGTVLYSLASSPPYFCNQTQGCAKDRAEHRTVYSVLGECMA